MVVPKKVYVLAAGLENKPRSRSRGANNGRRRSFPFPFRSSAAGDDSSISSNSYNDEEDDLQPVFQDVADALYKNTNPLMETALIDFSKRAKSEDDDDGDIESEIQRKKEKKISRGRRSLKPKSRPVVVRSQRREERPTGRRRHGSNARESNDQETKTKEHPFTGETSETMLTPNMSAIGTALSFESDEPIATERWEPAVSVRTEEFLLNGKHPPAAIRQASFAKASASQNRQQPTQRSSLPHNKSRMKEKDNPVKVHLPTNRIWSHDPDAIEQGNTEMQRSRDVDTKKGASGTTPKPTASGGITKTSRTRSLRGRSPINFLEAIPAAFSRSSSQGSRGRALGLRRRRSLSRNRSRSKSNRELASSSASIPPSQPASVSNASETMNVIIKPQPSKTQESQAAIDVVKLDAMLVHVIGESSAVFACLAKELGDLGAFLCCSNCVEEPKLEAAAAVECRNDTSTHNSKETVDASVQASEQRENSEGAEFKMNETSASQAQLENLASQPATSKVTPMDGFRSYMNFMIAASKQQLTLSPSNAPSTGREFPPPAPADPVASSSVLPATTTTPDQVSSIPSAAPREDKHGGLPPLSPQKPAKRTRSGNLQLLRIRFRRDASYTAGSKSGSKSGSRSSSRGSGSSRASDSTPSLLIEE